MPVVPARPLLALGLATTIAAGALLPAAPASAALPASAAPTGSGSDVRPQPERFFADDSFWYRELPDDTPVDPNSAAIVRDLVTTAEEQWGAPGRPNVALNAGQYSAPIHTARLTDPLVTVSFQNCQNKPASWGDSGLVAKHLTNINIPAGAVAAGGTDREMAIYNEDTDTLTELWKAQPTESGGWQACWGGSIRNVSQSNGVFEQPFGVTAAGLSMVGGTARVSELRAGEIDHVLGIALPYAAKGVVSKPATRTDAVNPKGRAVAAQGQMLRLPADVDIDALKLPPVSRAIAKAAQDHGIIVWDTAGAVSFRLENPLALQSNPYPTMLKGGAGWAEMANFPLHLLEVLPVNYEAPVTPQAPAQQPAPAPKPAQQPAPAPAPAPKPTQQPVPQPTQQPVTEAAPQPAPNKQPAQQARPEGSEVYVTSDWSGVSSRTVGLPQARPGDTILVGDWNGDRRDTLGLRRGNAIMLWNGDPAGEPDVTYYYGRPDDAPVVGDWNGDGRDTVSIRRGDTLHVNDALAGGNAQRAAGIGSASDRLTVGDWDGRGGDGIVRRAAGSNLALAQDTLPGPQVARFHYGGPRDAFLGGDFDGDGKDSVLVHRDNMWHVRNDLGSGNAHRVIAFGRASDVALVGDWDGNGTDTPAVVRAR